MEALCTASKAVFLFAQKWDFFDPPSMLQAIMAATLVVWFYHGYLLLSSISSMIVLPIALPTTISFQ